MHIVVRQLGGPLGIKSGSEEATYTSGNFAEAFKIPFISSLGIISTILDWSAEAY